MRRTINLIYLCFATTLCSCADYVGGTFIAYANDSNHHIRMLDFAWPDEDDYAAGIDIFPGEEFLFKYEGFPVNDRTPLEADDTQVMYSAKGILPRGVTVVFDNQYAVTYSREGEHTDLCYIDNYLPTNRGPLAWRFTYHFTDEHYEYARKYGTVLE